MRKMSVWMAGAVLSVLCSSPLLAADKAELARAEEIVGGRCFLCHGLEGESASPIYPRLAGHIGNILPSSWANSSQASARATP